MKDAYNGLIDLGYTQNQIDEMDILYHLELMGRRSQQMGDKAAVENDNSPIYFDDFVNGL